MIIAQGISFLQGIYKRFRKKGFFSTLNEMYSYSKYYNEILTLNKFDLSLKRKLSHLTFYSRICNLFPEINSQELFLIIPRSLTHSVYEKFNIDRRNLTFDKLKMYQKMIENDIRIPETYYMDNGILKKIGHENDIEATDLDQKIILKPRFSNGGDGIKMIHKKEIIQNDTFIYQKILLNHSIITKIQENNFCSTLRYVFYNAQEPQPIGASFQFNSGKVIDHMMKGGSISVLVNTNTGKLMGEAFDSKGQSFEKHPISNFKFDGFQLPNWDLVLREIQKISQNYPTLPIIAADICISQSNCFVLEINAGCGTVAGQLNIGWLNHPFFKDYYPKRPILNVKD
jgi:hypothetical protein